MLKGKFYAIDLRPAGHERTDLVTVQESSESRTQFRILASSARLHDLDGGGECKPEETLYFEMFHWCLNKCPVEEVQPEDLILWLGSPYQSLVLDDLIKGEPHHEELSSQSRSQ